MSEAATRLAAYGKRTFTRNGVRWRIEHIEAIENRLHIKARATDIASGKVLIDPDTDPHFDELIIVNPRLHVADGEEPNPEFNALDRFSQPRRVKFREDAAEALKIELDRFLARKQANA